MTQPSPRPGPYWVDDFFMIRAPLLPFETLTTLGAGLTSGALLRAGKAAGDVAERFAADCQQVRSLMLAIASDLVFREALFISSNRLHASIEKWEREPLSKRGAAAERSILKYITRASTRCTPYGLMAGVGIGLIGGATTSLNLGGRRERRRHARLDARLIMSIAQALASDPQVRTSLSFVPNSTAYRVGTRLRYFEAPTHPFSALTHLVTVAFTEVLQHVIDVAADGATWSELVNAIQSCDTEISEPEAVEFLEEIVQSQILIADVFPSPVGPEMLPKLDEKLRSLQLPDNVRWFVDEMLTCSRSLCTEKMGEAVPIMKRAATLVGGFLRDAAFPPAATTEPDDAENDQEEAEHDSNETDSRDVGAFQVDSILPIEGTRLSSHAVRSLIPVLDALYRINSQRDVKMLADFVTEFSRRYDDREVPLCEALDPEGGIRFGTGRAQEEPSPLLRVPAGEAQAPRSDEFTDVDRWRLGLLLEARSRGDSEIIVTSRQIREQFPDPGRRPPSLSFSVMFSVLGSVADVDAGRAQLLLIMSGGSHTLHLLGRFAHVLGEDLTAALRRTARREQAGTAAILAEVAYLPPSKLGNICQGPSLRSYTIPYRCPRPDASGEIIPIHDILVSVRGGRVVLRSMSLGAQIQPRVDHAMNVSRATHPAIFNFLGMLQHQDTNTFNGWMWGPLAYLPELPRVTIDNVVVSPRTWSFPKEDVIRLVGMRSKKSFEVDGLEAFARVQEWRARCGLPRYVAVGTTTDYLAADLDNPLSVDLMLRELRKSRRLEEMFHEQMALAVHGREGSYTHEIVLPVWSRDPASLDAAIARPVPRRVKTAGHDRRRLRVRDGVLYAKIYGGESALDKLLREGIWDVIATLGSRMRLRNWFYIRYYDPLPHLRLRVFADTNALLGFAVPALEELCERASGVSRLVFDAYEPETERYGGPEGIGLAEKLFGIDSRRALEILRCYVGQEGEDAPPTRVRGVEHRWLLVALSAYRLLDDFGMSPATKIQFLEEYSKGMEGDSARGTNKQKAIGALFRHRRAILDAIASAQDDEYFTADVQRILSERSREIVPVLSSLRERSAAGELTAPLGAIHTSLLHMHCNRMFISQQRRQEAALLPIVIRMLKSAMSRRRDMETGRMVARG